MECGGRESVGRAGLVRSGQARGRVWFEKRTKRRADDRRKTSSLRLRHWPVEVAVTVGRGRARRVGPGGRQGGLGWGRERESARTEHRSQATTEIYTLSLHDALPIWARRSCSQWAGSWAGLVRKANQAARGRPA